MEEIGKMYLYESRTGQQKSAVLIGMTKAWYIFSNGDWIERYRSIYKDIDEMAAVNMVVSAMEKSIQVPDIIHVPNRFLK